MAEPAPAVSDTLPRDPNTLTERLPPLLKWAGGKDRELKHILPLVPPFAAP